MLKEVGCGSTTPPPGDGGGGANGRQIGASEGGGGGGGGGIAEGALGCGGCGREIADRWYLRAADRAWHCGCLRCCHCRIPLAAELTCFARDGNIYCKEDYYRLFAVSRCSRCRAGISASELVMRARDLVYHVACFTCASCGIPLNKGDHFGQRDGLVYCRSSIDYLTERLTTDEHVAPKTTLRVAVLRRRLRGCRRQHRGPRLAGGVAAPGLLRAEPDRRFRRGAEGSTAEAEAVGSHRLRASCHDETGRWSARTAASHGVVLVDGVAGRIRRVRGLPGTGAPEPADEAYAHQFQTPSIANHEELFLDKSKSGRQGPQATRAEDRSIEKGAAGVVPKRAREMATEPDATGR